SSATGPDRVLVQVIVITANQVTPAELDTGVAPYEELKSPTTNHQETGFMSIRKITAGTVVLPAAVLGLTATLPLGTPPTPPWPPVPPPAPPLDTSPGTATPSTATPSTAAPDTATSASRPRARRHPSQRRDRRRS